MKDTVSTSPPIISGKLSSENVPQTFNVSLSTPETTEIENINEKNHISKSKIDTDTQTDILQTKLSGNICNPTSTNENTSSQGVLQQSLNNDKGVNTQNLQTNNIVETNPHTSRSDYHIKRSKIINNKNKGEEVTNTSHTPPNSHHHITHIT